MDPFDSNYLVGSYCESLSHKLNGLMEGEYVDIELKKSLANIRSTVRYIGRTLGKRFKTSTTTCPSGMVRVTQVSVDAITIAESLRGKLTALPVDGTLELFTLDEHDMTGSARRARANLNNACKSLGIVLRTKVHTGTGKLWVKRLK